MTKEWFTRRNETGTEKFAREHGHCGLQMTSAMAVILACLMKEGINILVYVRVHQCGGYDVIMTCILHSIFNPLTYTRGGTPPPPQIKVFLQYVQYDFSSPPAIHMHVFHLFE